MIKSTEQQFAVAGTVYCAVQAGSNFWVCGWDPKLGQYWAVLSVALFIMLYKGVLSFESVDEILKCDHSNESYRAVLSSGTVYCAAQGGSNFWVCRWNPKLWPSKWKLLSSTLVSCATVYYAAQDGYIFLC